MSVPVFWHYNSGFWDCALPRDLLNAAEHCAHFEGIQHPHVEAPTAVFVIPGRHSCGDYTALNDAARRFDKVVFIVIGDEEGIFHVDQLLHRYKKVIWFMPPWSPTQNVDWVAPNGYPRHAPEMIEKALKLTNGHRDLDWSFMGQMTHIRRVQCVDACQGLQRGHLLPTNGFTQGEPREIYYDVMVRSKIVLCPSGPCTPDSFRFAEALEAGCIPIVDDLIQHSWYPPGYWHYVLGDYLPFPVITDWNTLPRVMEEWLTDWDLKAERCHHWWSAVKDFWIARLRGDLNA